MQIVDVHHQRYALSDRSEKLFERGERTTPHLEAIGGLRLVVRRVGNDARVPQYGEHASERLHAPGQEAIRLLFRQAREPTTQLVDHLIDRLEWHRLALVAPPREHEDVGAGREPSDELRRERALSHPRAALEHDDDGRPCHRRRQRRVQGVELRAAPDEWHVDGRRGHRAGSYLQSAQHVVAGWARARVESQQIDAELLEVSRDAINQGGRRGRERLLLREENVARRAPERDAPRKRLEQDDADRVPIGRGSRRLEGCLLRRHVGRRPDERFVGMLALSSGPVVAGDAEVEQDHAPGARDHHVGRLDIAV